MTLTLQCLTAAKNMNRIPAARHCRIAKCRFVRTTTMFPARNDILQ